MQHDVVTEIGIDGEGRLYVKPALLEFPMIYREAMEVHWDGDLKVLYSPKPREWSYVDWFKQICAAAKEQGCRLQISQETRWTNVEGSDKEQIIKCCR